MKDDSKSGFNVFQQPVGDLVDQFLPVNYRHENLIGQYQVTKGRNRNTAWFSIIDEEWTELKSAYEAWLSPVNFDTYGKQKQRLADFRAR